MKKKLKTLWKHPLVVVPILVYLLVIGWNTYLYNRQALSLAQNNLLANGNFTDFEDNMPVGWQIEQGGTAQYQTSEQPGYAQGKSLQLMVSGYNDGNVDLLSPIVNVEAGNPYLFKGYYSSNSPFDLLMRSFYADGSSQLAFVRNYPVTDMTLPWTTVSATFQPSAQLRAVQFVYRFTANTTAKLSGTYLEQKNKDAITVPTAPVATANLVLAASAASCTQDPPADWTPFHAGTNTHSFRYSCGAGGDIFHTEIADYKNGEAKWQHTPVPAKTGQQFCTGLDYKSNVPTQLIAEYDAPNAPPQFRVLQTLDPSNVFTHVDATTEAPEDGTVSVTAALQSNGSLDVRNSTLQDCTRLGATSFRQPIISVTFDDDWLSAYTNGSKLLAKDGIHATYYVNPSTLDTSGYLTSGDVTNLKQSGNEIASHGFQHINLTTVDDKEINYQLNTSKTYVQQITGQKNIDFAAPYGGIDGEVTPVLARDYQSARGTDSGINTRQNFDRYDLKVLFIGQGTTAAEVQAAVDEARALNGWLILVYHNIDTVESDTETSVTPELFADQLKVIEKSGLPVMTVQGAMAELTPQL